MTTDDFPCCSAGEHAISPAVTCRCGGGGSAETVHDLRGCYDLSTPPAYDVREALTRTARDSVDRIAGWKHLRKYGGMSTEWVDTLRDAIICRVVDAVDEVRPRGTVTDAAALATRNNPNQPHPLAQSNPYRGEARS